MHSNPTIFSEGLKIKKCVRCSDTLVQTVDKLSAKVKLNTTNLVLQEKKSSSIVKNTDFTKGDSVKNGLPQIPEWLRSIKKPEKYPQNVLVPPILK